ncbi:HesB/YadR/YfhF family protein [Peribacillus sp. B-H-3]|uniref:HesB/YadR/YfhF family protein n=1 Tax=Peribacillus sp. B-H-3 TaxID=3400420 RepID=UPI003B029D55
MKIFINDEAAAWYKDELALKEGDALRFFARYGGYSPIQSGFSLGVNNTDPENPAAQTEKMGISFFVEETDSWYFDGNDLHIEFNRKYNEPEFLYKK